MAKKTDHTEGRIVAVEEALSKSEQFIERHQKIITIVIGTIVILVLGYFGFRKFYLGPREKEAQSQMFMAEKYFEMDSLKQALNGDGNNPGFLDIISDYRWTKSSNLAHYYAGICYLKKGEFENALDHLKSFKGNDEMVAPMAKGAIGDAYMELGDQDKAVEAYLKAADQHKNDFTTPLFLMKAGLTYEVMKQYDKSLSLYERIRKEYPRSYESREIDKYIARAKSFLGQS